MAHPADQFAALGHPTRLAIFRLLSRRAPDGATAGEIAAAAAVRPNTLSTHVAALSRVGLIRGSRAGRSIRYAVDLARAGELLAYLALDCCRGRPDLCAPLLRRAPDREDVMPQDRPFHVLFLCTGNSARSILAEAILNAEGDGRFRGFSAGTRPAAAPHPMALERLRSAGCDVSGLRSKGVEAFRGADAPPLDFVFTVCDAAANEDCPAWPGRPLTGHWGLPDPAAATGSEAERALAFAETYRMLKHRIAAFVSLPVERLDALRLQAEVDRIGRLRPEGAAERAPAG